MAYPPLAGPAEAMSGPEKQVICMDVQRLNQPRPRHIAGGWPSRKGNDQAQGKNNDHLS